MSVSSREIGLKAADMAVQLMNGKAISEVPVYTFANYQTYVNQTTLNALEKLTFPQESLQNAWVYP